MKRETSHPTDEQLALLASEEPDPLSREHLESCVECRRRWQQYVMLREALRALPSPALPRDFTFAPESVAVLRPLPWWWRHRFAIRVGTLLAATLLVMLLSSTLALPGPSESLSTKRVAEHGTATPIAVLAPEATFVGPGAGGEALATPAALEGTPVSKEPEEPSVSTFAAPEQTPAPVAVDQGQETREGIAGLTRVALFTAVGLLTVITLLGAVFGFFLPAFRTARRQLL